MPRAFMDVVLPGIQGCFIKLPVLKSMQEPLLFAEIAHKLKIKLPPFGLQPSPDLHEG